MRIYINKNINKKELLKRIKILESILADKDEQLQDLADRNLELYAEIQREQGINKANKHLIAHLKNKK